MSNSDQDMDDSSSQGRRWFSEAARNVECDHTNDNQTTSIDEGSPQRFGWFASRRSDSDLEQMDTRILSDRSSHSQSSRASRSGGSWFASSRTSADDDSSTQDSTRSMEDEQIPRHSHRRRSWFSGMPSDHPTSPRKNTKEELKLAQVGMKGTFKALCNYAIAQGAHPDSFKDIRFKVRRREYVEAMQIIQSALQGLPMPRDPELIQGRLFMVLNAWQALCRYMSLRNWYVRRTVLDLRHMQNAPAKAVQKAMDKSLHVSEQYTYCQKGLYVTQQFQRRFESSLRRRSSLLRENTLPPVSTSA